MESDGNITLVGEVILFKPRVGKVNFAQTTSGLCVIIPFLFFLAWLGRQLL